MPKLGYPELARTFTRSPRKLSATRRAAVLDALPKQLTTREAREAAVSDVEEALGWLDVQIKGEALLPDELSQVEALAEASTELWHALAKLSPSPNTWVHMRALELGFEYDRKSLERHARELSACARSVFGDIRPAEGRPKEWAEIMVADRLSGLWEAWAGTRAAWSNSSEGGGPFGRFAQAVAKDFSPSVIRRALAARAENSG
jgi:hypothetical protein